MPWLEAFWSKSTSLHVQLRNNASRQNSNRIHKISFDLINLQIRGDRLHLLQKDEEECRLVVVVRVLKWSRCKHTSFNCPHWRDEMQHSTHPIATSTHYWRWQSRYSKLPQRPKTHHPFGCWKCSRRSNLWVKLQRRTWRLGAPEVGRGHRFYCVKITAEHSQCHRRTSCTEQNVALDDDHPPTSQCPINFPIITSA